AMHYALIESDRDFAQNKDTETDYWAIKAALKTYKDFITLQAALVGRLSRGEITLEEYVDLDNKYDTVAKGLREKVRDAIGDVVQPKSTKSSFNMSWDVKESTVKKPEDSVLNARSEVNREIVESSLKLLSGFGKKYQSVIDLNKDRLKANFY
ncbi:MAG: hypothetical protein WBA74_09875, partial [Cyclobacteriaceae bacterium]